MTEENRAEMLPKFFHCSKREAKQVAAEMLPAAVVPRRTVVTGSAPSQINDFAGSSGVQTGYIGNG